MGYIVNLLYQYADNVAFLLLAALGLIVILGVVDVINLAQGELIMLGAYITTLAYNRAHVPLVFSMLLGVIGVALIGAFLERFIIRRFYRDKLAALVATWGISLIISQGTLIVFGPSMDAVPLPAWTLSFGGYSFGGYRLLLCAIAVLVVIGAWWVFYYTRLGVYTRATMQNPDMARALGVDTRRVYMLTFAAGSALAGLAGALYAPTTTIVPLMGTQFVDVAFITVVIGGGANPIVGALGAAIFLSLISTPLSSFLGTFIGRIGLLIAAVIVIRFLPRGISGYVQDLRYRRMARGAS
ncbi:MAG TPA: branched-chain amino acid ABC transporter permease [Burkholderiales bacterium]|nr:branched-chain amino acid ABC transporter permease [Burkholderiales bacterium]